MTKKIRKTLDLVPFVEPTRTVIDQTVDDFDVARQNTHDLLAQISDAITELADVSKQSQHPRAFEVLDKLFKTALDANKDLLNLQKQKQDIIKGEETPAQVAKNETHNHLYITTAEMNAKLNARKDKEIDDGSE